jgi:hypothetical protein
VLVAGGDPTGTLYGAYRLAEQMGVRFYMHGDVIPDAPMPPEFRVSDESGKPLFDRRGIQPFHDFPEGPDWWNVDGYKAILGQLAKLRMNFFGLHTYPEGGVGPEPVVWIGRPEDIEYDVIVKHAYPSRHFTTANGTWGYQAMKTSRYLFGAGAMYDRDQFGVDYMRGMAPWPKTPEAQIELFNRMGSVLKDSFRWAQRLGVKTCVGTETPLVIPTPVKERLKAQGKNPADPAVVQEIYEGMFKRIMQAHPLDYYWFWTPENWTWEKVTQQQIDSTLADFRAAMAAARKVHAPFTLATCGWVLGPPQQPALFDNFLPKDMPMSCINRQVGRTPVEPGFAQVKGRPKWAIPWMEDDPALTSVQLWAGRMRKDAADALAYGCTGLMGIHWRTRILAPNVAALAAAAWDQSSFNPAVNKDRGGQPDRYLPTADFYADWCRAEFGPEAAGAAAAVFAKIDCHMPRPIDWTDGPGGIRPDPGPWTTVKRSYAFVDEFARIEPQVTGAGQRERFQYWLGNFRYLRAAAQTNCTWAQFNAAMAKVKAEKDPARQKQLSRETALPIRKELVAQVAEAQRHLLSTVTNMGEMGTVTNWQQHNFPALLIQPGEELAKVLGEPLPADAMPPARCPGAQPHLFVPHVRTAIAAGEPLHLTAILVDVSGDSTTPGVILHWRPMGTGTVAELPLRHVARGVYEITLPPEATKADLEYYVEATTAAGVALRFPPTAPAMNQTVVVVTP